MTTLAGQGLPPAILVIVGVAIAWVGSGYTFFGAAHWAGPAVFPMLVGCGMALTGFALLVRGLLLNVQTEEVEVPRLNRMAILLVTIAAFITTLVPLGSTISAAILFVGTELAFGERRIVRAGLCGAMIGAAVYVVFGRMLGLPVPAGPILGSIG